MGVPPFFSLIIQAVIDGIAGDPVPGKVHEPHGEAPDHGEPPVIDGALAGEAVRHHPAGEVQDIPPAGPVDLPAAPQEVQVGGGAAVPLAEAVDIGVYLQASVTDNGIRRQIAEAVVFTNEARLCSTIIYDGQKLSLEELPKPLYKKLYPMKERRKKTCS